MSNGWPMPGRPISCVAHQTGAAAIIASSNDTAHQIRRRLLPIHRNGATIQRNVGKLRIKVAVVVIAITLAGANGTVHPANRCHGWDVSGAPATGAVSSLLLSGNSSGKLLR